MKIKVSLSEKKDRLEVHFPYDPDAVMAVKEIPGARFIPADKGGPGWRLPLDLTSGDMLRDAFGDALELTDEVRKWGWKQRRKAEGLKALANADDAELKRLPDILPQMEAAIAGYSLKGRGFDGNRFPDSFRQERPARPYQRADIAFMAQADCINANQPGTGKTLEAIGSVFESGDDEGSHLIVAPKTSLDTVWVPHLTMWQPHPVLTTSGDDSPAVRQKTVARALAMHETGEPFFLVMNPHMIRFQQDKTQEPVFVRDGDPEFPIGPVYPELFDIQWSFFTMDEYHKMGLNNPKTMLARAALAIEAGRKQLLSGTPFGGQPIKLWAALHFLDPGSFTSKWRWAAQWLEIEEEEYGKKIHGVRDDRRDAFDAHLNPYMVRRTKAEVLPQLPAKQYVDVWCDMTPTQEKQYKKFAEDAEIKIAEENLSATGILAEYTRLKQFADAHQKVQNTNGTIKVLPTFESGKLPHVKDWLESRGITGKKDTEEGDSQVVLFSQFSAMIDMVEEWMTKQGIACAKITGDVKKNERTRLVKEFQAEGGPRVMLMTTTAGGVSITLDRASDVGFLDETWNPDDQEQGEDRIHRGSRIHQVTCYYFRSKGTVEEYIKDTCDGKQVTNREILDLRRAGFRAVQMKEAA